MRGNLALNTLLREGIFSSTCSICLRSPRAIQGAHRICISMVRLLRHCRDGPAC